MPICLSFAGFAGFLRLLYLTEIKHRLHPAYSTGAQLAQKQLWSGPT